MNTYSPLYPARGDHGAQQTDRAGIRSEAARPVPSPIAPQQCGHFQSDGDFATPRRAHPIELAILAAARRADRHAPVIAIAGLLFGVLPSLCMWLAGGAPA